MLPSEFEAERDLKVLLRPATSLTEPAGLERKQKEKAESEEEEELPMLSGTVEFHL